MPDQLKLTRSRTALTLLAVAAGLAAVLWLSPAHASAGLRAAPPIGPAPVSPLGHPRLCWEAWSNGSTITLEACEAGLQAQQWTFIGGVLMNGDGYCLQSGPAGSLDIGFSAQCAGTAAQRWSFSGAASSISNAASRLCAYVQGSRLVTGAQIVARRCGSAGWDGWSQGSSDLSVSGPRPEAAGSGGAAGAGGAAGSGGAAGAGGAADPAGTGKRWAFTATATVSNGAKAMPAYGATVAVRPPAGLTVTRITGTGALSGWTCVVSTRQCRGDLGSGSSGQVTITGTVARRPATGSLVVRASVARTNQARHATTTAALPVRVFQQTIAAPQAAGHGLLSSGTATVGLVAAALLLVLGLVLALITRRRTEPTS